MKQNQTEKAERLFTALGDLDPKTVASATAYIPQATRKGRGRRILVAVLAATLCFCLVTLTVFAAVPSLRGKLNLPFLSESERQETVPEGWVGIYTVEDLDNVRHDLGGKYILMNDLTFADGAAPFTPIGSRQEPFTGQFDGNGHVIRGLTIEVTQETPEKNFVEKGENGTTIWPRDITYVGLFGYCLGGESIYPFLYSDKPNEGIIANLGIEGARITLTNASHAYVGVIAGTAYSVAGCYVKDCTVTVNGYDAIFDTTYFSLFAGGLVGQAQLMDSCYADHTNVTVTDTARLTEYNSQNMVGALAGNVYTAVTSYVTSCTASSDHPDASVGEQWGHVHMFPTLMNETQFLVLLERFYRSVGDLSAEDPLPADWPDGNLGTSEAAFRTRQFRGLFNGKTVEELAEDMGLEATKLNPSFFTGEFSTEVRMYVALPMLGMEDYLYAERILSMGLDAETVASIMTLNNCKIGPLDCYTLDPAASYQKSDFASFNFDTIWRMKEGRPVLRIFEE